MKEIQVGLSGSPYKIYIDTGALDSCGERIRSVSGAKRTAVISDERVWGLYGSRMEAALKRAGLAADAILVKPGEESKTVDSLSEVCGKLAELGVLRDHLVIAFGGGVVGDLAGFAAAVYMRGIPYVQIPTTLLAQVDSSVGGKTAVDLPQGKNLLGAFHQPRTVIIDPELLRTLDKKQMAEGMAEVIKYGAIADKDFFEGLEQYGGIEEALSHIEEIIYRSCDRKRIYVEEDEKDRGERQKLNFGHSFGHAIEKMGGYKEHTHGEAVAMGMVMAAEVGELLGVTRKGTADRIRRIVKAYGLPAQISIDVSRLFRHMTIDKKNDREGLKLILLREIGDSLIRTMAAEELEALLRKAVQG